jgi:hypothetical protein
MNISNDKMTVSIQKQVDRMINIAKERGENKDSRWALSIIINGAMSQSVKLFIMTIMLLLSGIIFLNSADPVIVNLAKGSPHAIGLISCFLSMITLCFMTMNIRRIKIAKSL